MKNANSRFVRVLALVLVVLMVVPAALVGCGSKKANDAAISEALAAAQAAKEAAEQAKKDAEAAIKEAEEKAQAALDAAKEAQDKLDALTTTGPVTEPVVGNKKEVSDYAYKVLNDTELDFLKTFKTYTVDKNAAYMDDDIDAMKALKGAAELAITTADTIDYINQLVANFVAEIEAIPTYVERVVAAYEAIDFDSDYDVIDVVYAYNLLAKADPSEYGNDDVMTSDDYKSLAKYGEDAIDIEDAIKTEYYRYTGKGASVADVEVLYEDMFDAAADVAVKVYELFGEEDDYQPTGEEEWDASKLPYVAGIDKNVAAVKKAYSAWYNSYFAKDEALAAHFEAFRQAFVGVAFVLDKDGDFLWETVEASEERAAALVAAAQEYKDTFKSLINKVAGITTYKYWTQAAQVAEAAAALDAWKLKYDFKTDDNGEDANVALIIGSEIYANYKKNATVINYFVYLANTASAVNVEGFVKAFDEDLHDNNTIVFDFAKYASAVSSVLDWYYGKKDSNGNRDGEDGFKKIVAADVKGFEDLGDEYDVANLADNANLKRIYKDLFGFEITEAHFDAMEDAYDALAAKKKEADKINKKMEKLLEDGISAKNYAEFVAIAGEDYLEYVDEEDETAKAALLAGSIKDDFVGGVIAIGDKNFDAMIDWDNLDAIWDAYTGTLTDVIKEAEKIVLEYIAWKEGPNATEDGIVYDGVLFEDLKPLSINAFSYSTIAEIVALKDKLDIVNVMDDGVDVMVTLEGEDDAELKVSLEEVVAMCTEMRDHFYNNIFAKVDALAWTAGGKGINNFASFNANYTEWMKDSSRVTPSKNYSEAILGAAKGVVDYVLNDFKYASTKEYKVGNTTYSYQAAVAAIDPLAYVKKNSSGVIEGLDTDGYKKAIQDKIAAYYPTWLAEFIKDVSNADKYTTIINNIYKLALNYGLWEISGEIEIDGEEYTYSYAVGHSGTAPEFTFVDSYGDAVVEIEIEINSDDYVVTVAPVYEDGKVTITPTVAPAIEGVDNFDVLGLDEEDLTFDIREQAETIANAFAQIGNVKMPGSSKNYQSVKADALNAIFAGEAQNDFWVVYKGIEAKMFTKNSNGNWNGYGVEYLKALLGIAEDDDLNLDDVVKAQIELLSRDAYDRAVVMDASNATVEDIETVFNLFEKEVKATLKNAGLID